MPEQLKRLFLKPVLLAAKYLGPYAPERADTNTGSWRSVRPEIKAALCIKCGLCKEYCPSGVISEDGQGFRIDYNYCKGCQICVNICPREAIKVKAENEER